MSDDDGYEPNYRAADDISPSASLTTLVFSGTPAIALSFSDFHDDYLELTIAARGTELSVHMLRKNYEALSTIIDTGLDNPPDDAVVIQYPGPSAS